MDKVSWFAVKCLFLHKDLKKRNGKSNYEERILLVKAKDFDEAIEKAENEALEYCDELGKDVEYLKFCNAYHISESKIGNKTEIYSLITKSDLNKTDFINTHHDNGGELTKRIE